MFSTLHGHNLDRSPHLLLNKKKIVVHIKNYWKVKINQKH